MKESTNWLTVGAVSGHGEHTVLFNAFKYLLIHTKTVEN